ncbi:LysR family transcriptional regulator (plasmid) [Burkholderia sp. SFA1]|uniref:LysR substrate-binding domain-containing protein n=1 Tax=unclassified Caballeronia TaxID=2646786 RepID=UPI001F3021B3|nr:MULTISPECIES: LysR substrate-binding domain-containing protein [unclassified Caballeronia]MCE4547162.1 LysR substrate-binding domain-containing protein [Caballeronia sp. PC1]MCE4572364.1 LysR substrate-binding domain-containing protein [Caballeronia sp. CLC5]BBQ02267.1 LysR family transcriptional regulator [Burkholderia sp. SFA1]
MQTPRPSLNALRAFEAVARLRSMTLAAQELCVTHGAISRQVKALEDTLGLTLLVRSAQSSDPTPEGKRLAEGLTTAFNLIDASIEQLKPEPLTLSCSATIMMNWLIPRIAGFHRRHPQTELKFNMNYDQIDFVRDKISVAIRASTIEPPKDAITRKLIDEWIGPVCSPEYAQSIRLAAPADLSRAKLLSTRTRPEAWDDWYRATNLEPVAGASADVYDHFYLLIQAAVCGLGVALVPQMLVMNDLVSGKLVAPFGFAPGPRELVLWVAPHLRAHADVAQLERWLIEQMSESLQEMTAFLNA